MNRYELQYLCDINQQLNGSIRQAGGAGMASRQLYCMQQLVASLAAEREANREVDRRALMLCREQLPALRELLAGDEHGRKLVASLEQHCHDDANGGLAADLAAIGRKLGASRDSRAAAVLSRLIDADVEHWREVDAAVARLSAPAEQDRETEPFNDAERLRLVALLQEQYGEGPNLAVSEVNALAGGFSKQTIIVTLCGNSVLPSEIVVRRDRAESPVGSTVIDEFELLKTLHTEGVAVPQPLAIDHGSVLGNPLIVVPRINGRIIGDPYDIFDRSCPNAVPTLARELARLHRIPLEKLTLPLPGHDVSQASHLRGDIEEFHSHWRQQGEASVVIEAAFEWLDARFDQLPTSGRCITHRDMRFHNILVDDHGVSAILDWEIACIGRPARDLGFVYRHISQLGDWRHFLDTYRKAGGEVPEPAELDFYILWSDLLMTIWMYRARASHLASGGGNIQLAFAGERMRQHNLRILAETLGDILRRA